MACLIYWEGWTVEGIGKDGLFNVLGRIACLIYWEGWPV
jgi:hypothetical protein